jgi:glycosyltransferase involved in cell wall biosynthesis
LPALLSACEAQVMPSTFPEAFGMVAVEAAACGVLPLSASHSGMAEVTATLAPALARRIAVAALVRNRAWSRAGNR